MTILELKQFLKQVGIPHAIHDRGQHFLLDETVVESMIAAAEVKAGDVVVEIGPGPGILTRQLLKTGAVVIAIEIDHKLCQLLNERFSTNPNFFLKEADVRDVKTSELLAAAGVADKPYKVVANIPYNITSELISRFLTETPTPTNIALLVQKEVGERIKVGSQEKSSSTVFVQTLADSKITRQVPAVAFYPPPQVDSCVLSLTPKTPQELAKFFGNIPPERFFKIIRASFQQKRKKLKNGLNSFASNEKLDAAFIKANIGPNVRAEELSIEQWQILVTELVS